MSQEFLPLCDVLFNIISLVSYFCDVVFDLLVIYTLYINGDVIWFSISLTFVLISLISCQVMSFKWHMTSPSTSAATISTLTTTEKSWKYSLKHNWQFNAVIAVHLLQCGVLWRYFKLFIPVDLRYVKKCLRDLCLLRLTHAFCQAAPLLLIQLHFIWKTSSASELTQLSLVSTSLSLVNVCWALASFNKHIRLQNLHKLVLTWLGVIYQFMWRLGTVSSRVTALSLYATMYNFWLFLVIGLHWISMFLWLISPKNVFHGEAVSRRKKMLFSLLISYVYIFCYVNLLEVNSRKKMIAYYVTMFLENSLLITVWLVQQQQPHNQWFKYLCVALVWGGFAFGILFMILYYRYFHVKRLKHGRIAGDGAQVPTFSESTILPLDSNVNSSHPNFKSQATNPSSHLQLSPNANYVPGVFNCRLNPAFKRKKKKPTTFIPLPVQHLPPCPVKCNNRNVHIGKSELPFWKRPLPKSDRGSSNSLVDIRLKLQEKRQQQLQELRVIEEEIKQGKLQRPNPINDVIEHGTIRQPIPQAKKQPYDLSNRPILPSELILAPKYLNLGHFDGLQHQQGHIHGPNCDLPVQNPAENNEIYKSYRCMASDLDSQLSLPRSFTLPREFRYHRKTKQRKNARTEHFITSTNSSDGDVDSDDGHHFVNKLTNTNRNCCNNSSATASVNNKHHETQL